MTTNTTGLAVAPLGASLLLLACWTTGPELLAAQRLEPRPFPQVGVRSYRFQSALMGRPYDISIGFPVGYEADPGATYPAIVVTDGNRMFPEAYGMARGLMSPDAGVIEPLFVVSIGTPYELGDTSWVRRRIHEFSPPDWVMQDRFGQVVRSVCGSYRPKEPQAECTGGAPKFLEFIVAELLPALTAEHRIDRNRLALFGVSAGGFFAAWTIFQERSPFQKYLISSPAMAYGDGEIYRQEERYAASHRDLPVGIYVASGDLEIADPFLEGIGQIVSGHARLAALLKGRGYPGLVLHSEIHHGLGHSDSAVMTLARGLRLMYSKSAPGR